MALYQPKNEGELRAVFLRDVRLAAIDAGLTEPPTSPGSDWDMLAGAVANMALLGFANLAAAEEDNSVLTAQEPALDDMRRAEGLDEVVASPAAGKIVVTVTGSTTITNGQVFVYPNGFSGKVVGTYLNPADQAEVSAMAIDTGTGTNLAGGETVRFKSPPVNLGSEAKVSKSEPLRGGTSSESPEEKRARILDARRNKPAGGNWSHVRKIAKIALGSVQDCYVYPALGGPGSVKVVPVKDLDPLTGDFTRAMSSSGLAVVRAAIQSELPTPQEVVVQAVVDQLVDFSVLLAIPSSSLAGGNGRGWTDNPVWPLLVLADGGRVSLTSVTASNTVFTIGANTAVAPIAGQTHVAWWSAIDRRFQTALVTAVAGAAGAWIVTLDHPFVGDTGVGPAVGDYISPAAQNLDKYGDAWIAIFRGLGPGENLSALDARLPRALRHPFVTDEDPSDLTNTALGALAKQFGEITNYAYGYAPVTTPTVPGSVDAAPKVLTPRKFGVYKI